MKQSNTPAARLARRDTGTRKAFSLIELLVVIIIITLVVAIVIPALASARTEAKKTDTRALVSQVVQGSTQFELDNRRPPGYFSARNLADATNVARGFSGMENAMLDLAGGIVPTTATGPNIITVGPGGTNGTVRVDPGLIGVAQGSNKAYFAPPAKFFKRQNGTDGGVRVGDADHQQMPVLVDSFGTPILFWGVDKSAVQDVVAIPDFVKETFVPNQPAARFYWAHNATFLSSQRLGDKGRNHSISGTVPSSMISSSVNANNRTVTLAAYLGNPSAYDDINKAAPNIFPTAARGTFTVHSAGPDAWFLSNGDRGGKLTPAGVLYFGLNFKDLTNNRLLDSNGNSTTIDLATQFDDISTSGGA